MDTFQIRPCSVCATPCTDGVVVDDVPVCMDCIIDGIETGTITVAPERGGI